MVQLLLAFFQLQFARFDLCLCGGKLAVGVDAALLQLPEAQLDGLDGVGELGLGGEQLRPLGGELCVLGLKLGLGHEKLIPLGGVVLKLGFEIRKIRFQLGQHLVIGTHGNGGIQGGLSRIPGGFQNGEHHVDESQTGFQLAHAALDLKQSAVQLGHTRIHLLLAGEDLLVVGHQLVAGFCELGVGLRAGIGQGQAALGQGGPGLGQGLLGLVHLHEAVFQKLSVVRDLLLAVQNFLLGLVQLQQSLVTGLPVFGQAVQVFAHAVGVLIFRVGDHGLIATLSQGLAEDLQPLGHAVHGVVVCIGVDLVLALQGQVDLRIDLLVDAGHGDVAVGGDGTAADGGGAPLHVQIHGGADGADDGVGIVGKGIQSGFLVVFGDVQGLADDVFVEEVALHQTFVRGGGHPARIQGGEVQPLRDGHELEGGILLVAHVHQHIQGDGALTICDALGL